METSPNILTFMNEVTTTLLETSIGTTATDSTTLELVTTANENMTKSWLSDSKSALNPEYNSTLPMNETTNMPYLNPVYNALFILVLSQLPNPPSPLPADFKPVTTPPGAGTLLTNFGTFIDSYLTNSQYQDDLSSALVTYATSVLSNPGVWPSSGGGTSVASGYLTTLNSVGSQVSALAQQEEQILKTDSSTESSMVSLDGNTPSQETSAYDGITEQMNAVISILQAGGA